MENSDRRVTTPGKRARWWMTLMSTLDPERDAWALIKTGEARYHQGRDSTKADSQSILERPSP